MKRRLSREDGLHILSETSYGVLSMVTPEGQAYGLPIHHVFLPAEDCIIFHCALKGKKLDCMQAHPEVSFSAVRYAHVIAERFSTQYESVIVSGCAELVKEEAEKLRLLILLSEHFSPGEPRRDEVIQRSFGALEICRIAIEEVTAKRNDGA